MRAPSACCVLHASPKIIPSGANKNTGCADRLHLGPLWTGYNIVCSLAGTEKCTLRGLTGAVASCCWVGKDMVVSSSQDGTTKWWQLGLDGGTAGPQAVGSSTIVPQFFDTQSSTPLATFRDQVAFASRQGSVMVVKLGAAL